MLLFEENHATGFLSSPMISKSSQIGQFNLHRAQGSAWPTAMCRSLATDRVGSLSKYSGRAKSDQAAGEMEKGQIVLRLFVPTDEQATKAVHPRMCPLHDPPPRFEARFSLDGFGLLSSWANMGGKAELMQEIAHLVVVVALRQAHPLRLLLAWLGTVDDDAFDGRTHEFHIVAIGALNRQTDWQSVPLGEQAAFHPALAPIGGIGASFFPHPTGLWSSPRPLRASPSRGHRVHQTAQFPPATT
jgi:hypothetical protein